MKLRVLSDLHLEFFSDSDADWLASMDRSRPDVLVLAGDITAGSLIPGVATRLRSLWGDTPILWVPGNHEYYRSSYVSTTRYLQRAADRVPGLFVLDREALLLDGVRFVCATLWYPSTAGFDAWPDSRELLDGGRWIHRRAVEDRRYLERTVQPGDVVVTHMLPSTMSIAPQHISSPFNHFFVHDCEELIYAQRPALWIHGHTHASMDYTLGSTRVLCNPRGVAVKHLRTPAGLSAENPLFDPELDVDVDVDGTD
jgi:Icc-related predicted phosphoesterase